MKHCVAIRAKAQWIFCLSPVMTSAVIKLSPYTYEKIKGFVWERIQTSLEIALGVMSVLAFCKHVCVPQ